MASYAGMSENAVKSYAEGNKPKSRWNKKDLIIAIDNAIKENKIQLKVDYDSLIKLPLEALKEAVLGYAGWHHTGRKYNETDFWGVNDYRIGLLTDADIVELKKKYALKREQKKNEVSEKWLCEYRVHTYIDYKPRSVPVQSTGIIKGNWFRSDKDGTKHSIKASGFKKIKEIK
jgi:hypothetical protein